MQKTKNNIICALKYICMAAMAIQIAYGFVWMSINSYSIPIFGDTTEYLELSETLAPDEYRPILFPLLLRALAWIEGQTYIPYHCMLYWLQTIISFGAILFAVVTLFDVDNRREHKQELNTKRYGWFIFVSLYLLTISMNTFMNLTVLTDSLANSMLIIFLTCIVRLFQEQKISLKNAILMIASLIIQDLLRADRFYSTLLLLIISFVVFLVKNRKMLKNHISMVLVIIASVAVVVLSVNHFTQKPGSKGRIQTNFEFILLDRVVWRNMSANYPFFSEEITNNISMEEAQEFDSHNNKVMYQMAPMLEQRVGKERASQMYVEMASVVFDHQTKKVIHDITEDTVAMFFTPISSYLSFQGKCEKADSWNVYCVSGFAPELTDRYNRYSLGLTVVLLAVSVLVIGLQLLLRAPIDKGGFYKSSILYFGMSLILTLWFSLGDGAPPNDRYALIIYFAWGLICVHTVSLLQIDKKFENE